MRLRRGADRSQGQVDRRRRGADQELAADNGVLLQPRAHGLHVLGGLVGGRSQRVRHHGEADLLLRLGP